MQTSFPATSGFLRPDPDDFLPEHPSRTGLKCELAETDPTKQGLHFPTPVAGVVTTATAEQPRLFLQAIIHYHPSENGTIISASIDFTHPLKAE